MPRPTLISHGASRRPLPANALGLPLDDFGERISATPGRLLVARATHTESDAALVEEHAGLLARLEAAHGATVAADRYLDCPTAERRDRVASAVTVSLLEVTDPELLAARDGHRPPDRTARRMSPLELGAVRTGTFGSPMRAINVALAETGAVVGQHVDLTPDHVRLHDGAVLVRLASARGVVARTVTLPRWANALATAAVEKAGRDGHRLCLSSPMGDRERDRKAVTATLDRTLAVAGCDATAGSIRLTSAHDAYDAGGLIAATGLLGVTTASAAGRLLSA